MPLYYMEISPEDMVTLIYHNNYYWLKYSTKINILQNKGTCNWAWQSFYPAKISIYMIIQTERTRKKYNIDA